MKQIDVNFNIDKQMIAGMNVEDLQIFLSSEIKKEVLKQISQELDNTADLNIENYQNYMKCSFSFFISSAGDMQKSMAILYRELSQSGYDEEEIDDLINKVIGSNEKEIDND